MPRRIKNGQQRSAADRKNFIFFHCPLDGVRFILLSNLLLFTVVFSVLGLVFKTVLGLTSYRAAFFYFLALGEGLGLFDLVVIDLLWWRNTKRIRFSFLPEKAPYQDPQKHISSFVRGIPLFAAVAAISAGIVSIL